jgi:hypothetical protein
MTGDNRILLAQIIGLLAIVLARFGVELDAQAQADILAGLSAFGLVLTALLAKSKKSGDEPGSKRGGFISPPFAGTLIVLSMFGTLVLTLPGCASTPKPLNTIAGASRALNEIALQIDIAQKSGQISNEREDKLLDELKRINGQLRLASTLTGEAQASDLKSINDQLIALRAELAKEQKR